LVFGDSHARSAVVPSIIGDCFNYASGGESYLHTYYKITSIISEPEFSANIFLLPLEEVSFASVRNTYKTGNYYHWRNHINYLQVAFAEQDITVLSHFVRAYFMSYVKNMSGVVQATQIQFGLQDIVNQNQGHYTSDNNYSLMEQADRVENINSTLSLYDGCDFADRKLIGYLDSILYLCDKNEIDVIFINYPVTDSYYNSVISLTPDELLDSVSLIASTHPSVLGFLDYSRTLSLINDSLFYDSNHLNSIGAYIFSTKLKEDIYRVVNGIE